METLLPTVLPQPGLEWKRGLGGYETKWTVKPQISVIQDIVCEALDEEQCTVMFQSQGAFNKIYSVQCKKGDFIMRVSLPVDPYYKTLSEVATLDFVRINTDIPVPKVFAFDSSNVNKLGFEWILMEAIPGESLLHKWRVMSLATKSKVVKRLAHFASQLFRNRLQMLGNLYPKDFCDDTKTSMRKSLCHRPRTDFTIDRMVSIQFFLADHVSQDVPRGPFHSSKEWLSASLRFHQNDCERILKTSDDEDDREDAERTAEIIRRLSSHMLEVAPPIADGNSETTALLHDDLSLQNILVDKEGNLTGVVDWECVSALPLWKVCQFPHMLEGKERNERPEMKNYARNRDGSYDQLFWDHLMEFEQTLLRKVFLDEMQNIEPDWVDMFWNISSQRKADFELAVQLCSDEFSLKVLEDWLDELPDLEGKRLRNRLV